jgi:hypothetical protein
MDNKKPVSLTKEQYKNILNDLQGTELQQESFHNDLTWDQYVAELDHCVEDDKKLKQLIRMKDQEELVNDVTLERIMSSNFMSAKEVIEQMTIAKRIKMLDEVYTYREFLYENISRYGMEGLSKDEQLTANEFRLLMGRIKHLEILQNWLFGIV